MNMLATSTNISLLSLKLFSLFFLVDWFYNFYRKYFSFSDFKSSLKKIYQPLKYKLIKCLPFWGTNPPPQLHNYWVSIKKVNQILKLKCCESSYTFASHDRGWTIVNGSLNADFYYSDWLYLVEKGNLKMVESIFDSIEVSDDSNHNNKFIKSYKMTVF